MRYLVTIGVPDSDIPRVSESVELMARCLSAGGYQRALPELASLTSQNKTTLQETLSDWAISIQPDDLVILYFAGHGASKDRHFLGLPATDWTRPATKALPTEDLLRCLTEGTNLHNLLLILDTCYSGQAAFDAQSIAAELVKHNLQRSFWLITASWPKQEAGDGAFACAFDKLLRSGGATIRNFDIPAFTADLELPPFQRATWTPIGPSSTRIPDFLPNPNFISEALQGHPIEERSLYRDDLRRHWKPRAMGSEATFQGGHWYFTGRTEVLRRILTWLEQPVFDGSAFVVTGDPGSGKSAVLGYVVTASDLEELRHPELQEFLASMPVRPEPGSVSFALHLKGKSLSDTLSELASHLGTKPDNVLATIAAREEKTVLVFDALDESAEASKIGDLLLRPLTGYAHLRLIVGTRRPEISSLGERIEILDLDKAELKDKDVALYVKRLLLAEREKRISPYRGNPDVAEEVATAVAAKANGNFLIARIIARSLIERSTRIDLKRERLPGNAKEAFADYLRSLAERSGITERTLRDALTPLAYAQGQGLPRDIWSLLANTNVDEILTIAEAFLAEYVEDGRSVYRLFHEALSEVLRNPKLDRERHRDIAHKLLEGVPGGDWFRAHWYTRKYLAVHAAQGDPSLLDRLVLNTRFLIAADTQRLLSVSDAVRSEESKRRLNWLGLASDKLVDCSEADMPRYLGLVALQNGALDLAAAAQAEELHDTKETRWRARWARWQSATPHRVLRGHEGSVEGVAVAEGIVVSGSADDTIRRWDLKSGQPIGEPLRGHEGSVEGVAVAEGIVVSGSGDDTIRRWDLKTGQPIGEPLRGHEGYVSAVAVAEGIVVSGSGDDTIRRWDLKTGQPIGEPLRGHEGGVSAVAVAEGIVVSGSWDDTIRRWDLRTGQPIGEPLRGHEGSVNAVAVADGIVVSGSWDKTVRRWDLKTGQPIGEPLRGHEGSVETVAVAEGIVVSGSWDDTIRRWDLKTGQPIGEPLRGHEGSVETVAVAEGIVVSGSRDNTVRRWDLKTGQPIGEPLRGHEGSVETVAVAEGIVVSGSRDNTVRRWDLKTGQPIGEPLRGHEGGVYAVAVAEGMVVSGGDNTVRRWDLKTGQPIGEPLRGHEEFVNAVAVAEGIVVSGSSDNTVRRWDIKTGQPIGEPLRGHEGPVETVAVAEGIVVSGSSDNTVRRWDIKTGQPIGEPLRGHEEFVYAVAVAEGIVVSGSSDNTVRRWDIKTGQPIGEPLRGHEEIVNAVAVAEGIAISGSWNDTIRRWDLKTGQLLTIIRLGSAVKGIALVGETIIAACQSGLVRIDTNS